MPFTFTFIGELEDFRELLLLLRGEDVQIEDLTRQLKEASTKLEEAVQSETPVSDL